MRMRKSACGLVVVFFVLGIANSYDHWDVVACIRDRQKGLKAALVEAFHGAGDEIVG